MFYMQSPKSGNRMKRIHWWCKVDFWVFFPSVWILTESEILRYNQIEIMSTMAYSHQGGFSWQEWREQNCSLFLMEPSSAASPSGAGRTSPHQGGSPDVLGFEGDWGSCHREEMIYYCNAGSWEKGIHNVPIARTSFWWCWTQICECWHSCLHESYFALKVLFNELWGKIFQTVLCVSLSRQKVWAHLCVFSLWRVLSLFQLSEHKGHLDILVKFSRCLFWIDGFE